LAKKVLVIVLISVLLFSLTCGFLFVNLATAGPLDRQYLPELTIKSDGSITIYQVSPSHEESPALGLINRTENIYTLTADIENYSVRIDRSNILFDGGGHTINALGAFDNSGLEILQVTNVTVKNLEIIGENPTSVFLASSNCFITNITTQNALRVNGEYNTVIESSIKKISLWGGGNHISNCSISEMYIASRSGSNIFTANNILLNNVSASFIVNTANFWDNGSVGNYWSNYTVKYPNASELGNSGIGDTAYVIDQNNIDHYPLTYPYDVEKDEIVKSTQEPETPSSFTPVIAGVSMVTAIGITSTVFYCRRYRKP
jgi:hypothetical protein